MESTLRQELLKIENENFLQVYSRLPIVVSKAEGAYIWDEDGTKYLDFLGGIAVNVLGHSHPKIIEAITIQSSKYLHLSNYFYQEAQITFAEQLTKSTNYPRVFLTNSGTESVEGALKLIRKWGNINNKNNIIAFEGGFHGRSYGALSLMDKPIYKSDMGPFLSGVTIIKYNSPEELELAVNPFTTAVFLEFLQGEGGIVGVSAEFVDKLLELKEKYNFLIVADEVQAGMGRTGKFFSFEHYNIKPDIVLVSKGLGGGLPLGAILTTEELANVWDKSQHGTTFGGNALSCAVGKVVLEEINNSVMQNVLNIGEYFYEQLRLVKNEFPEKVKSVRGRGLMLGLELSFEAKLLLNELLKENIITNATSVNVLRLVPPLIITKEEVDIFIRGLNNSLKSL
jgi:predicted acetylornithine/succinylornithine family transaminase